MTGYSLYGGFSVEFLTMWGSGYHIDRGFSVYPNWLSSWSLLLAKLNILKSFDILMFFEGLLFWLFLLKNILFVAFKSRLNRTIINKQTCLLRGVDLDRLLVLARFSFFSSWSPCSRLGGLCGWSLCDALQMLLQRFQLFLLLFQLLLEDLVQW